MISTTAAQAELMDYAGYFFNGYHNFNTHDSSSFERRKEIFQNKKTKVYTIKPVTFIGHLFHDLNSCATGIPPGAHIDVGSNLFRAIFFFSYLGVEIKIVLSPNDPEKMIDYYVSDPAPAQARGYKIKIDRIELHCPIG